MLRMISMMTVLGVLVTLTGCNIASGIGRDLSLLGEGLAAAPSWGEEVGSTIAEEDRQVAALPWPVEPAGIQPQYSTQADQLVVTQPFYPDNGAAQDAQYQVGFEQEGYNGYEQQPRYSAEQYYDAYQQFHQR